MLEVDTLHGNPLARRPIPLLRGRVAGLASNDDGRLADSARDPLAPSRGIGLAVALCLPVWAGIGALVFTLI